MGIGNLFLRGEERAVFWRNPLLDVKAAANIQSISGICSTLSLPDTHIEWISSPYI